jgi:hypothetical protein
MRRFDMWQSSLSSRHWYSLAALPLTNLEQACFTAAFLSSFTCATFTRSSLPPPRSQRTKYMWLVGLRRNLYALLSAITRQITLISKAMYEGAIRFTFGPHPLVDEEAAGPLLHQQERELEQDTIITNIMATSPPSPPPPSIDDYSETRHLPNPDKGWDPDDELMARFNLRHGSHTHSGPFANDENTYPFSAASTPLDLADTGIEATGTYFQEAWMSSEPQNVATAAYTPDIDCHIIPRTRLFPQPEYGEAFLDLLLDEREAVDTIFWPVRDSLLRLKATTPESLPDYHAQTRTRSHAQILSARLSDAATQIQRILRQSPAPVRGTLELRLW